MTATPTQYYITKIMSWNPTVFPTNGINMSITEGTTGYQNTSNRAYSIPNTTLKQFFHVLSNRTFRKDNAHVLKTLNDEVVVTLIPVIVILSIMMVVGLLGNPLAIYFYCFKMKPSPSNLFIVALAISDFIFCLVCLPVELTDLVQFYNFKSELVCKLRYIHYVTNFVSSFILVYIAIDRYRRIIMNYKKQMSMDVAKMIILITVLVSITIAVPTLFLYGIEDVRLKKRNIIAHDCTFVRKKGQKLYVLIYVSCCFFL